MIRLGVAVRVLGRGGMPARDGRRARNRPHLSVSLLYLRDLLLYLAAQRIGMYRLADDLAPYLTHPGLPAFHRQIEESADLLAEVGGLARAHGIRLTMHLGLHVALSAPDDDVAGRAACEIAAQARLLAALGCGAEGTLVLHVGGAHGDAPAALERFARRYEQLPEAARRRLAVEPDEDSFTLNDLLRLHQMCGVPVVLDTLHLQLNNPRRLTLGEALGLALATWPAGVRPKIHVSTQRTEAHALVERGARRIAPPRPGQHADFINPFEFAGVLAAARGLPPFDVMLEAKAGDLALLRLREDLARYAPEVGALVR